MVEGLHGAGCCLTRWGLRVRADFTARGKSPGSDGAERRAAELSGGKGRRSPGFACRLFTAAQVLEDLGYAGWFGDDGDDAYFAVAPRADLDVDPPHALKARHPGHGGVMGFVGVSARALW